MLRVKGKTWNAVECVICAAMHREDGNPELAAFWLRRAGEERREPATGATVGLRTESLAAYVAAGGR